MPESRHQGDIAASSAATHGVDVAILSSLHQDELCSATSGGCALHDVFSGRSNPTIVANPYTK
jgi:hypothetical protein